MSTPLRLDDIRGWPLQWPEQRKRISAHARDGRKRWTGSFDTAMQDLQNEMSMAGLHSWILSSNLKPHTRAASSVEDPAAAVWFNQHVGGTWRLSVLACDAYASLWVNVKAIAMTLNRMRLIGDYGVYQFNQAIQGAAYLALPAPTPESLPWRDVLSIDGEPPKSAVELVFHYRFLARKFEGDQDKLKQINVARDEARKEMGVPTE